jgi:hypothetical protein
MKKNIFLVLAIFFILLIGGYLLSGHFSPHIEAIHIHAGFQVYVDGKLQDFSRVEYMSIEQCRADQDDHKNMSEKEIQLEKAHLHGGVGDVVHIHIKGAKWKDLFINIKYDLPLSKGITAFVDGKEVKNILNEEIKPYQSVVILIGKYNDPDKYLKTAIKKDKIIEAEKEIETCGTNK